MVDKNQIIQKARSIKDPIISGVYFLIDFHDQIIYVGSSADLYKRLSKHKSNFNLSFNRWFYIEETEKEKAKKLEIEYIKKLKPKFNIQYNPIAIEEMNLANSLISESDFKYPTQREEVEKILLENGIKPKLRMHQPISQTMKEASIRNEKYKL